MKTTITALKLALICSIFIGGQAFGQFLTCVNSNNGWINDSYARVKLDHPLLKKYGEYIRQADDNRLGISGNTYGPEITLTGIDGEKGKFVDKQHAEQFCTDLAKFCENTFPTAYKYLYVGYDGWTSVSFKYIDVFYDKDASKTVRSICPNPWYTNFPDREGGRLR